MSKSELQNEIVKKTEELPEALVREILDFAEFLLNKQAKTSSANLESDLRTLSENETAHLEKEFEDYRLVYPRVDA